jgi:hypothetical protein
MTGRYFSYQVFWKEYRQMRGFWLAVLGLTVMLQVIVYVAAAGMEAGPLYGLAVCFSVLYALGCGATTFAVEHENGTYEFLRSLPTRGLPTFFSKVAFTFISAPLLVVATLLSARIISRHHDLSELARPELAGGWIAGSLFLFLWATLFSLLMRHVVKAALLGGLAAVFSVPIAGWLVHLLADLPQDNNVVAGGVAVMLLVAGLDIWYGSRWFREAPTWSSDRGSRARREELAQPEVIGLESMPTTNSMFGHLAWLQWRQSRGMVLILTAMVVAPILFSPLLYFSVELNQWRWLKEWVGALFILSVLAAAAVVPLAGANVFAGDQRQCQFRFLTERGISARLVWWSRHPVWCVAVVVWIAVLLTLLLFLFGMSVFSQQLNSHSPFLAFPAATVLCIALAYCIGQFCSIMFCSGILCSTFAIVGAILLACWAFTMSMLGVPLFWSVLPIPVILLVATRVRTRGWMLESNTIATWLPVVLIVGVPGAAILSGTCLYRAYEIPRVEPGFDVAAFTAPAPAEAQETARMYCRAYELLNLPGRNEGSEEGDEGRISRPAKEEALGLALEASRRADCDDLVKYLPANVHSGNVAGALSELVASRAAAMEKQGDLDGAAEYHLAVLRMLNQMCRRSETGFVIVDAQSGHLRHLVGWCEQPGQTKDRIVKVIREVEELTRRPVPMDNAIKAWYVRFTEMIEGDLNAKFQWAGQDPREVAPALMVYWMPWERERARRAVRMQTLNNLEMYEAVQTALDDGDRVLLPRHAGSSQPREFLTTPILRHATLPGPWIVDNLVSIELDRRATLIQMALAAWQLDHQSLPETLDELKGEHLAEVPCDPCAGEPFVYFPKGLEGPVKRYRMSTGEASVVIEGNKPFLWSPGLFIQVNERGEVPQLKYFVWNGPDVEQARSPEQIWAAGVIFPIPQPRGLP